MGPYDDRFYDELHRAGDTYQRYRDMVSEEQASHAKAMGKLYGDTALKTTQGAMQGADWRQQRELRNQDYQAKQQDMSRAEENQGYERQRQERIGEEWGIKKPMLENDASTSKIGAERARMEHEFMQTPVGAEEAQALGYKGDTPLSRYQASLQRRDRGEQLGLDTAKQQLANARQAAGATAQQIAQNAQLFKNQQYQFEAQRAAGELDDIYGIRDPKMQAAALEDWRQRHGSKLLAPETLTNMAQGGATRKQAAMAQADAQRAAETKLIYGSAIAEAQEMTQKLNATQQLAQAARTYDTNAKIGGAWENENAKDARENAAMILTQMGNHNAADKVRSGMFAGARGLLTEQARAQAQQTLREFNDWYARQDNRVQELPEVKRAYQQSQALQAQLQSGPNGPAALRKLPSLVGGMGGGANVNANRAFMQGDATGGMQPQTQAPAAGHALGTIPLPGYPPPQAQQPQPQPVGQVPGMDPLGLQRSARPRPMPAGVQGGYNGSR